MSDDASVIREVIANVYSDGQPAGGNKPAKRKPTKGRGPQVDLAPIHGGAYLRRDAAEAYNRMVEDARKEGVEITLTSRGDAYRSYEQQLAAHRKKPRYVAHPDHSNHPKGTAVDISGKAAQDWVKKHGRRYGFTWGERKDEDWHFTFTRDGRSAPRDDASIVREVIGMVYADPSIGADASALPQDARTARPAPQPTPEYLKGINLPKTLPSSAGPFRMPGQVLSGDYTPLAPGSLGGRRVPDTPMNRALIAKERHASSREEVRAYDTQIAALRAGQKAMSLMGRAPNIEGRIREIERRKTQAIKRRDAAWAEYLALMERAKAEPFVPGPAAARVRALGKTESISRTPEYLLGPEMVGQAEFKRAFEREVYERDMGGEEEQPSPGGLIRQAGGTALAVGELFLDSMRQYMGNAGERLRSGDVVGWFRTTAEFLDPTEALMADPFAEGLRPEERVAIIIGQVGTAFGMADPVGNIRFQTLDVAQAFDRVVTNWSRGKRVVANALEDAGVSNAKEVVRQVDEALAEAKAGEAKAAKAPESPVADTPAVDAPVTVVDTPAVDAPVTVADTPAVDAPVTVAPSEVKPKTARDARDAPVTESPVVDAPVVDAPLGTARSAMDAARKAREAEGAAKPKAKRKRTEATPPQAAPPLERIIMAVPSHKAERRFSSTAQHKEGAHAGMATSGVGFERVAFVDVEAALKAGYKFTRGGSAAYKRWQASQAGAKVSTGVDVPTAPQEPGAIPGGSTKPPDPLTPQERAEYNNLKHKSVASQGRERGYKPYRLTKRQRERLSELEAKIQNANWERIKSALTEDEFAALQEDLGFRAENSGPKRVRYQTARQVVQSIVAGEDANTLGAFKRQWEAARTNQYDDLTDLISSLDREPVGPKVSTPKTEAKPTAEPGAIPGASTKSKPQTKISKAAESARAEAKSARAAMDAARKKQAAQMKRGGRQSGQAPKFLKEEWDYYVAWTKEQGLAIAEGVEAFLIHAKEIGEDVAYWATHLPKRIKKDTGGRQASTRAASAKNQATGEVRAKWGFDPHPSVPKQTIAQWEAESTAQQIPQRAHQMADAINEGKGGRLSDVETVGFAQRIGELDLHLDALYTKAEQVKGTPGEPAILQQIQDARMELDSLTAATKRAGTPWGREGVARRESIKADYSESGLRARIYGASGDTPKGAVAEEVADAARRVTRADERVQVQRGRIVAAAAEASVEEMRRAKGKRTRAEIRADKDKAIQRLVALASRPHANPLLDPQLYAAVYDIAKLYVEEGVVTLGELITRIRTDLPDNLKADLTTEQIRYGISRLWDTPADTPRPTRTLAYYRAIARLTEQIKQVLDRTYKAPAKKNFDATRKLRRELQRLREEFGDIPPTDEYHRLEARLADMETRYAQSTPEMRIAERASREIEEPIAEIRAEIADLQETMRLEERLHTLNEEIRTGERTPGKAASERVRNLRRQVADAQRLANELRRLEDAIAGRLPPAPRDVGSRVRNIRRLVTQLQKEWGITPPTGAYHRMEKAAATLSDRLNKTSAEERVLARTPQPPKQGDASILAEREMADELWNIRQRAKLEEQKARAEMEEKSGQRIKFAERIPRVLEDDLYKLKMDAAAAREAADDAVRKAVGASIPKIIGSWMIGMRLTNVVSFLIDTAAHVRTRLQHYAVTKPLRQGYLRLIERAGLMGDVSYNVGGGRIWGRDIKNTMRNSFERWRHHYKTGARDISESQHGAASTVGNIRSIPDLVARDESYREFLSDVAMDVAKRAGIDDWESIFRQITGESESKVIPWKMVEGIREEARLYADYMTYNNRNMVSDSVGSLKAVWRRKLEARHGKHYGGIMADTADAVTNLIMFANKVLFNVVRDRMHHIPEIAAAEVAVKLAFQAKVGKPLNHIQALDVANILAKGTVGAAAIQLGRYLYENGVYVPTAMQSEGGFVWIQNHWVAETGGVASAIIYGANDEAIRQSGLTQKQKDALSHKNAVDLLLSIPLGTHLKDTAAFLQGELSPDKWAGKTLSSWVIPAEARRLSRSLDKADARKTETFVDEWIANSIFWRDMLPEKDFSQFLLRPGATKRSASNALPPMFDWKTR